MTIQYLPLAIANYFIEQSVETGGVAHLKLQKLVYCAHGWWLQRPIKAGEKRTPLVSEVPQAWSYGPVFSSLYHIFKVHGRAPMKEQQRALPDEDVLTVKDEETRAFLSWVWKRYIDISGGVLADLTHRKGTPWYEISKKYGGARKIPPSVDIPIEAVRKEFMALADSVS